MLRQSFERLRTATAGRSDQRSPGADEPAGTPPGAYPAGPGPYGEPAGPYGTPPGSEPPYGEPAAEHPVLSEDAPTPGIRIQLNALQALCRQVFGFRLAMIAIGAPFALSRSAGGIGDWLVGGSILITFVVSYALLRDWERFGPVVLRYPALLGADVLFLALLLLTASPNSPVGYATVSTPLLAGLLYGWRGAGIFTGLQLLVLAVSYNAWTERLESPASTLLLAGFCVAASVVGVTLRNLMFHFGTASQALTEARARIAVGEAVESERARLARDMHDSVAKTLHGLALSADSLARSADRTDPAKVRSQAEEVARAARRAAAESRDLLADLRHGSGFAGPVDLTAELREQAAGFTEETGVPVTFRALEEQPSTAGQRLAAGQAVAVGASAIPGQRGPADSAPAHPDGPSGPTEPDWLAEELAPGAPLAAPAPGAVPPMPAGSPGSPRTTAPPVTVRPAVARQALTIAAEAMENAHRHAHATHVTLTAGCRPGSRVYRLSVQDDGCGLPPHTDLADLQRDGHYGLLGMVERAQQLGARIRIGRGEAAEGTEVRLELPLAAITQPSSGDAR